MTFGDARHRAALVAGFAAIAAGRATIDIETTGGRDDKLVFDIEPFVLRIERTDREPDPTVSPYKALKRTHTHPVSPHKSLRANSRKRK